MDRPSPRPDPTGPAHGIHLGRGRELGARLDRFVADARVDDAVRLRERERWLRRQAEEDTTLSGVLADLRDASLTVAVRTRSGGVHRGRVTAVGADHVVLADAGGRGTVVVALVALTSVRTAPDDPAVLGDRAGRTARTTTQLVDVLGRLAEERAAVRVVTLAGDAVGGVVRSVGRDVVVVGGDETSGHAYLPVVAVSEVVVEA
jgi:hypothetical protein